jgi:cysteine desulfurase
MLPFLTQHFGNPSSSHALGRAAGEAVEDARGQVANLIGADRDEIVFTSSGTESNNLALWGIMSRAAPPFRGHLVISQFEHPAVAEPAAYLQRLGCDVTCVPCNSQGVVEPQHVLSALRSDTRLVSIMHANNEIGTVQPIAEIASVCHERDVLVHTDAAQSAGKVSTLVDQLEVDLLTIAGHKLYAPKGVGALYVRRGVALEPLLHGAGHEGGLRPGTENVASIVGLGRASAIACKALDDTTRRIAELRDRLLTRLRETIGDTLVVHGERAPRLPNTLSVNFPQVSGADLLARLPELMASTGSACHSGHARLSPTLQALGLPIHKARGTIRLSLGWNTSEEEIDRAAELLLGAWEALYVSP